MKNIWIIDHYSSEPQYGGISRQYDFAMELAKRDYNVVVLAIYLMSLLCTQM